MIVRFGSSTLRFMSKENEDYMLKVSLNSHVHCSIIYNNQDNGITMNE
jgi:hypothetical protein